MPKKPHMPTDVTSEVGVFDRFAAVAAKFFAKPWFFALCLVIVLLWAPSIALIGDVDTWQLIINTGTTIITFLMVALLQNTQTRQDEATQDKLNAIAEILADMAKARGDDQLAHDVDEVRAAVGLEDRESA